MKITALSGRIVIFLYLPIWITLGLAGCAGTESKKRDDLIDFVKVAEFADSRGQAKIKLFTYSGLEVEIDGIRAYAENLGCGMIYAYFYPDSLAADAIPINEINNARTFVEAEEILFQGGGYARWDFASQCLGMIPTVNDCRQGSLSMRCR